MRRPLPCHFYISGPAKSPTTMTKQKRSIVSPERAAEIGRSAVYVITCGVPGCACGQKDNPCERGFFSLFIQVVYGIDFAARNGIAYHVDFTNIDYCYTDAREPDRNWWNYYFRQPVAQKPADSITTINRFHELYPIPIWDRHHLRQINWHVRTLTFQDDVLRCINAARKPLMAHNTLGVHVRRTDHPHSVQPVGLDAYYRAIDKRIRNYDLLFLSTDDERVVHDFRKRYGAILRVNNVTRSGDQVAVHRNFGHNHRRQLGLEVLVDCLCLAACNKLILTFSNVSYAALLFNPEASYILLEKRRTTWRRYKTLIVYFLDKWRIRKW